MKKKCPKCGKEDMRVWALVLKDEWLKLNSK